jgi:hypothetical protein
LGFMNTVADDILHCVQNDKGEGVAFSQPYFRLCVSLGVRSFDASRKKGYMIQ